MTANNCRPCEAIGPGDADRPYRVLTFS